MLRQMCKSKIHRATITDANLEYEGSLTLDAALMRAANLVEFERVQVLNINNAERLETYLMEAPAGSGTVCLNGAAARLGAPGDKVIIISYALVDERELTSWQTKVVYVDEHNHSREVRVVGGVAEG